MALIKWAVIFFAIALVAALFGFGGIAEGAASIGQVLFVLFLALCVLFVALGVFVFKKVT